MKIVLVMALLLGAGEPTHQQEVDKKVRKLLGFGERYEPHEKLSLYLHDCFRGHAGAGGGLVNMDTGKYKEMYISLEPNGWSRKKVVEKLAEFMSKTRGFDDLSIKVETVEYALGYREKRIIDEQEVIRKLKEKHTNLPIKYYRCAGLPVPTEKQLTPDEIFKKQGWYVPNHYSSQQEVDQHRAIMDALQDVLWKVPTGQFFTYPDGQTVEVYEHLCGGLWEERDKHAIVLGLGVGPKSLSNLELDKILCSLSQKLKFDYQLRLQTLEEAIKESEQKISETQKEIIGIKEANK